MSKVRALVIDDSQVMRNIVMQCLGRSGMGEFEFTEAGDGEEGLKKFSPANTDIVFVDWNMPVMTGIEFVRRFQWILYSETHKWKPDAMVETQTVNALFRESSDLIRLNDIWYATRNVPDVLRLRAGIAHISGWPLVDTDNASSTTLKDWWAYMQAQPTIGIPALYFVTRTESTQESPSDDQWTALAALWRSYIDLLKSRQ